MPSYSVHPLRPYENFLQKMHKPLKYYKRKVCPPYGPGKLLLETIELCCCFALVGSLCTVIATLMGPAEGGGDSVVSLLVRQHLFNFSKCFSSSALPPPPAE